ncbi:hypothetical protein WG901_22795 [Novosphingobium sp. PS1R-30]|uniref:PAS domain-containing protein n=1 Tax=Novosphingobium anseongense TaxID=3133436 RepID=A0ABU8S2B6_9SPHN
MEPDDYLPMVLEEIKGIMSADGIALSLHADDAPPTVVSSDFGELLDRFDSHRILSTQGVDPVKGTRQQSWLDTEIDDQAWDVMQIPIKPVPGHSRLLLSVFFRDATRDRKAAADQIYAHRRPFALGYFHLWQLARQKTRQINAFRTALDGTGIAVFLLNSSGEVLFYNNAAGEMTVGSGSLVIRKGVLETTHKESRGRLRMVLHHVVEINRRSEDAAASANKAVVLSVDRAELPPLILSVIPGEHAAVDKNDVAAIVFALDPSREIKSILEPICRIYSLSPVETRLTCLLVSGSTVGEAAVDMGIKEATARGYLKQVLRKTKTERQSDLLRLMLTSAIRMAPNIVPESVTRVLEASA